MPTIRSVERVLYILYISCSLVDDQTSDIHVHNPLVSQFSLFTMALKGVDPAPNQQ